MCFVNAHVRALVRIVSRAFLPRRLVSFKRGSLSTAIFNKHCDGCLHLLARLWLWRRHGRLQISFTGFVFSTEILVQLPSTVLAPNSRGKLCFHVHDSEH